MVSSPRRLMFVNRFPQRETYCRSCARAPAGRAFARRVLALIGAIAAAISSVAPHADPAKSFARSRVYQRQTGAAHRRYWLAWHRHRRETARVFSPQRNSGRFEIPPPASRLTARIIVSASRGRCVWAGSTLPTCPRSSPISPLRETREVCANRKRTELSAPMFSLPAKPSWIVSKSSDFEFATGSGRTRPRFGLSRIPTHPDLRERKVTISTSTP